MNKILGFFAIVGIGFLFYKQIQEINAKKNFYKIKK